MRDSDNRTGESTDGESSRGVTSRRGLLKTVGAAGAASAIGSVVGTATADEEKVNVMDYGAAGDGETDDTQAITDAADAAAPDGTVFFPATDDSYLVGSEGVPIRRMGIWWRWRPDEKWDDLTFKGANYKKSEIKMAGGQEGAHFVFQISPPDDITGVTFEQLTINQNGQNQDYGIGVAMLIGDPGPWNDGVIPRVDITDCHFKNATTGAVKPHELSRDVNISNCKFTNTAIGVNQHRGNAGHPVGIQGHGNIHIEDTHFENTYGTDVDLSTGSTADLTIERCIGEGDKQWSGLLKVNEGESTATVRNTHVRNRGSIPIKANPKTESIGTVRLEDVLVEDVPWPGFDFPAPGRIELENFAVKNVDLDDNREAGVYTGNWGEEETYGMEWDGGTISVHNVGSDNDGVAIKNIDASGTLDKLVYDGARAPDSADLDGLEVGSIERGEPLEPDVPTADEIGPRLGSKRRR